MKTTTSPQTHEAEPGRGSTCRTGRKSLLNRWMVPLAILAAAGASAWAAGNSLTNASFEMASHGTHAVITGWQGTNNYAIESTNDTYYNGGGGGAHVLTHSGTNVAKLWGMFWSGWSLCDVHQDVATGPTTTWAADCWAMTHAQDYMAVGNQCWLEVSFQDISTNALATYRSGILSNGAPASTWIHLQVTDGFGGTNLAAPDGTAFVRCRLAFSQPPGYPGGSAYLDDVNLTKTSVIDPELTVQPLSQTIVYGQPVTFSVVANGQTALSYKWQKDGANITDPNAHGVNTATLTLSNVTVAMQGAYTCTVSDQAGQLTSDAALLTVSDPGIISITPPLGQTVSNGLTAKISVNAAGSSALNYMWALNGNFLSDNGHFSGTTTSNLTVANVAAADAGTYTVYVNGGAAQATSGLKVVLPAQAATNLLVNAGFEDGVLSLPWETAWGYFNGTGVSSSSDTYYGGGTPVSVFDGNYVGRTYNNGNVDDGINQTVPALAGATYHAGGHFYVSSLDPVTGTAITSVQLMFKNAAGNTMATYTAAVIDTNFVQDAWTSLRFTNANGSADLVAPAGTAFLTYQVYEYCPTGGGSVWLDDLYVRQTQAAPPPAVTLSAAKTAGQFNLSFPSAAGVTYEVLSSSSATAPIASWQTNATVLGDGSVKTVPDTLGAAARFYRVLAHY